MKQKNIKNRWKTQGLIKNMILDIIINKIKIKIIIKYDHLFKIIYIKNTISDQSFSDNFLFLLIDKFMIEID